MIDLIIPYYNNPEGILTTLNSINMNIFDVTIIDDGSNNYLPPTIFGAQVYRYNDNRGPGRARQWGIDHTSNLYIMFLDTGDIFVSKEIQEKIPRVIQANPQANIISFPYYYKDNITNDTDNRMHGKIYKRSFLDKYDITFCAKSSYMNEDIGFNRTCRLCTEAELKPIVYMSNPIIRWIENENSLTHGNVLYTKQTRALSLVSIHTIEICRKNNIDASKEINQIAIALYYWFIVCAAEKPEYLQEAWNGAKLFYDYFHDKIRPENLWIGSAAVKKCLSYKNKINFPINILRFAHDIFENKILPNYYLT